MQVKKVIYNLKRIRELVIILLVVIVSNMYLKKEEIIIKADGKGYYEYLPAIFIYKDLHWNFLDTLNTPGYYKHNEYDVGAIKNIDGIKRNKYFVGTAILMSPFFLVGHAWAGVTHQIQDGYTKPYQKAMWFSALFYLWAGLFFLRKLLVKLKINLFVVFIVQLLMVFATPLLHYVTFEATFSHVYSFCVVTALIYYCLLFVRTEQNKYLYLVSLLCFLTFLIRPFNVIILLIVPFFFQDYKGFVAFIKRVLINKKLAILKAILLGFLLLFVQAYVWFLQTGAFIIDSYGQETFDFSNPQIVNILFSYKKGLFIYSPVLFLGLILATIFGIINKKYYKAVCLIIPLLIFTYILSSWWSWWYGMSYGQRSYIDILVVFAIIMAYGLNQLSRRVLIIVVPFFLLTIPITVIQCFQYKTYILHWDDMNKNTFWEVFLKTEDKYRGVLWQNQFKHNENQIIKKVELDKQILIKPNESHTLLDIHHIKEIGNSFNLVELKGHLIDQNNCAKVILILKDAQENIVYWNQIYTYHQTRAKKENKRSNFQFLINQEELNKAEKLILLIEGGAEETRLLQGVVNVVSIDIVK